MAFSKLRVLVTGASGFIGKNLVVRFGECLDVTVVRFVRGDDVERLSKLVADVDSVIHLAGENRPKEASSFELVNVGLTQALCDAIRHECFANGRHVPLVLASSTQAERDNDYGRSKLGGEKAVEALALATGNPCVIFRLPGVFGKWCKPDYNSVVATFCYRLAHGLPIQISDPTATLPLVYVDDVITAFIAALDSPMEGCKRATVFPEYSISLGDLAEQIRSFSRCRVNLVSERVGKGFVRALYATYVSYLPTAQFSYSVPKYEDLRGVFVEMLKTPDSGQFSYFTAHPGVTRGGHYHHTKTEKFLVIKGDALFRFRNIVTDEVTELRTNGGTPTVVDTIPGWSHDITNVGSDEMVVMLWANENFDREKPDTVASKVVK